MKSAPQFESGVLKLVTPFLHQGGRAEFFNGTLFVEGLVFQEAKTVLGELQVQYGRVRMSQQGSYQTDYTFAYDFVE